MTRLLLFFSLFGAWSAQAVTQLGQINGAEFRIDLPDKWEGAGLVVYCHGYSPGQVNFESPAVNSLVKVFAARGFAVAQSAYATTGWAIRDAMEDTQELLRYFVKKYGAPKETYVTGHSMGGFLTMAMLEQHPEEFDGGLAMCGPLAASSWFMARRVFDLRVVFDYYFQGALPSPVKVPEDFGLGEALNQKIQTLLDAKPKEAEALLHYSGIHSNHEYAGTIVFFTYILKDLQQRSGGNPFDNRNVLYQGTPDDRALNDGVKRYAADPRAAQYLRTYYTPTGRLSRPMLAIHTTYDPLVPAWIPNMYENLAEQAGAAGLFVQQYVKHDGHCAITPEEIGQGFQELRDWRFKGTRPEGGALK